MREWMACCTVREKIRALSMAKPEKPVPVDIEGDPMIAQSGTSAKVGATADTNAVMQKIFTNSLFELYTTKLRHNGVETFLVASMLFNVFAVLDVLGSTSDCVVYAQTSFLVVNVLLLISAKLLGRFVGLARVSFGVSLLALVVGVAQFWVHYYYYPLLTPRLGLVWITSIIFLANVSLPAGQIFAFLASCLLFISYLAVRMSSDVQVFLGGSQGLSIILHLMTVMVIGFASNWLTMREHERAYNEAKQSLEVKMVIEEQSAEQERLLLSVLPEHVAVQMRQDLGADDSEQFKKIYMSRHENVSILYADIVGFTAISSTYSAQDLVKMLNELFARFDRLAEKYHQLRIKILGDCYYCISGAPVERPDHAALCVHMGLSMVKAIKYVQQKTNSPVDMRVGIHTGAILAGILGQRQWQFDVYSKDVELANKMESSGLAGRVHISEKTLGYLKGEFEVEPAFGEKREETLRIAGLKTYFIKKVLIPFQRDADAPNTGNGAARPPAADGNGAIVGVPKSVTLESIDADHSSDVSRAPSTENGGPSMAVALEQCSQVDMEDDLEFSERLRHELLDRDRHRELHDELFYWYRFAKVEVESAYAKYCEPLRLLPYVSLIVVTCINSLIMSCILPLNAWRFKLIFIVPAIMLSLLMILLPEAVMFLYRNRRSWGDILTKDCNHAGHLVVRGFIVISLAFPLHYWWCYSLGGVPEHYFFNPNETEIGPDLRQGNFERFKLDNYFAVWDEFHAASGMLIMICIALMSNVSHLARAAMLLYANVLYLFGEFYIKDRFGIDLQDAQPGVAVSVSLASLPLCLLARHNEMTDRVLFRWKTEVIEQKERASDMRRRNEALVYNILPVHVAEHFMSNKHRSYDDLYSQSYDEVGVLFASMPNFSDFYSEDTVNNQGLECLRFLNEVISDFDALLGVPRFQDVIKIKTIGSTYMAASGLNPSRQVRPEDPVDVRWEHLSLLVDFALELKKALQCINEQSFNHFVLKMGINHGPITAGVIGARKPHYDIWGNTVNVASRMESTGKAGAVQVTEETCHILQTFGYTFEQRGLVAVKGKGQLMTYYLQGRTVQKPVANSSPAYTTAQTNPLETLAEVDESRDNSSMGQPESPLPNATKALKSPSVRKASRAPAKTEASSTTHPNDTDASTSSTPLLSQLGDQKVASGDGEHEALIGSAMNK